MHERRTQNTWKIGKQIPVWMGWGSFQYKCVKTYSSAVFTVYTSPLIFKSPFGDIKQVQKEGLGVHSCPCAFWVLVLQWLCVLHSHNAMLVSTPTGPKILSKFHWVLIGMCVTSQ